MQGAVEQLAEWKRQIGILLEQYWGHCNAHIEPALASVLDKVLLEIEEVLGKEKLNMLTKLSFKTPGF